MRITRRGLQLALGVAWLLDGALQLQPFMFGSGFAAGVLTPAGANQPGWVAAGVNWAAGLVAAHPAGWDVLFAGIQLALGVGLLVRPLARIGLAASIGWALAVWYFGEGLGGLASGHASLLTGAPGAVLLYAVLAGLAWPPRAPDGPPGWRGWLRQDGAAPPAAWTPVAWAVVWVGAAVLQALPGQHSPDGLADSLDTGMVSWLVPLNHAVAGGIRQLGTPGVAALLAGFLLIGLAGLGRGRWRLAAGWAGLLVAAGIWVVGEGFGMLTSGQATDPNSGPLLGLLAIALLGTRSQPAPAAEEDVGPVPDARWAGRVPAPVLSGVSALAVLGVGLLWWATSQPAAPTPPPNLAVSNVYTPAGAGPAAPVYFSITNTGAGADTLLSAGAEFQTAGMTKGVTVCGAAACPPAGTVSIPPHATMVFTSGGPHLLVSGTGALTVGHPPLQLTLTFARSGVLHVLVPVGSPANLTQHDVMTYGFMGHANPGMGMGDGGSSSTTSSTASTASTMPGMPGMTMPGG